MKSINDLQRAINKQKKLVAELNKAQKEAYEAYRNCDITILNDESLSNAMFRTQFEHSCAETILWNLESTLARVTEIEKEGLTRIF